ncbi:MAG: crotonase/enoyl-CoA hydratase family protein [Rhodothermales bacterium]|nr:crotonase/enoyl-CoA hydratase family protein [Rhodothermales bacterium]
MKLETIAISEQDGIAHIELNRPDKANAMNSAMWKDLRTAFDWLSESTARVGVLSGRGDHFTAGIDLAMLAELRVDLTGLAEGRRQEWLKDFITELQAAVNAAETCRKPVLAAIHGACIGGGVDLVTACDMRYCTEGTRFSVKEVDLAIVPDVGTLQRLPGLVGEGLARELAYTGRQFDGADAHAMRLVNRVYPDRHRMLDAVRGIASTIARKSPLTIRGIKDTLNYSRDHSVPEGLAYVAAKNAATLISDDLTEVMLAAREGREPNFDD